MKKTKKMLIMLMAFAAPIIFTNKAVAQAPVSSPTNTTYGGATEDGGCSSNTTGLLTSCPSGSNNTGFGTYVFNAGCTSSCSSTSPSGTDNTAVGYESMFNNAITNNHNTAVGSVSQYNLSSGSGNSSLGYGSLYTNTTGLQNTAIGTSALYYTTGSSNVGVGYYALNQNGAGGGNVGIGFQSLMTPSASTSNNTAVGYESMQGGASSSYGTNNVGLGFKALFGFTTAQSNTAVGSTALTANTTGSYNVAVGNGAMNGAITGNNSNVSVGSYSGGNVASTSDIGDIYLGAYSDKTGTSNVNDAIAIGYSVTVTSNEQAELGDNNATTTLGRSGYSPSYISPSNEVARLELDVNNGNAPFTVSSPTSAAPPWVGGGGSGWSGLRFDELTSGSTPATANPGSGVLGLDNMGNVIYINTNTIASGGNYWSLIGNSLTGAVGTYFLGTTSSYPLEFECNGNVSGFTDFTAANGTDYGNAFFGYKAGNNGVTHPVISPSGAQSSANTAMGYQALMSNGGNNNTAVGYNSMATGTGGDNTAIGYNTLNAAISGSDYNTALGSNALSSLTDGDWNTAIGDEAMYSLSTGTGSVDHNVAVGWQTLYTNTSAGYNTVMGNQCFYYANDPANNGTSGSRNVGLGYQAGFNTSTGYQNTFVGNTAGISNTTGYCNTYVGDAADVTAATTYTNVTCLGYGSGACVSNNNQIQLGNGSVTTIWAPVNLTICSDKRIKDNIKENVPGLSFISLLKPVTYNININKEKELLGEKIDSSHKGKYDAEKITRSGFLAQDVEAAANQVGYDFSGVVHGKVYELCYTDFIMPLVKSVQELSTENTQLKSGYDSLKNVVQSMQACLNQICSSVGSNANGANNTPANVQEVTISGSGNAPILYQNNPNPFSEGTKINYFLPEGTTGATMEFFDSYGNKLKEVQLTQTGNSTVSITPDNLTSGVYSYSLVVNNKVVDTKRMVLQK